MDRQKLATKLQELYETNPDLVVIDKDNKWHMHNTVPNANQNERLGEAPHSRTLLIFIEEITEFIEELTKYANLTEHIQAYDNTHMDESYIGILEELCDIDLTIHTTAAALDLPDTIYETDKELIAKYLSTQSITRTTNDTILCCTRISKHLSKYIRGVNAFDETSKNTLATELNNLCFLLEAIKIIHCIPKEDIILTEYIKRERFLNHKYNNPYFVPNNFKIHENIFEFNEETALGKPQVWIYLSDDTTIEITHESYDVKQPFFSICRNCSEKDFEDDTYHATCGVISSEVADNMTEVIQLLTKLLDDLAASNIHVQNF